jgi:predicted enzyme related to lactoylglutathione lyase
MATHTQSKPAGTPTWNDLMAPDIDAARAFYHAVFNWEYDIGGPEFGGYTTARVGERSTAGLSGPMPGAPPMPGAWNLYFASDDLAGDVARAIELGAEQLYPPMVVGEFGAMAGCADPTGAPFSFWKAGQHLGAQVTNEPGATAWHELYTPNAKQARDFYTALLGATADLMPGGLEYYVLKHGEDMICAIMQIDPAWGDLRPQWVSYFGVASADETAATISANGGTIMGPIDDSPFGRIAAVMDPSGAMFKIVEVPQS